MQAMDRLLDALRKKGEDRAATRLSAELQPLGVTEAPGLERLPTGFPSLDRALGGGLSRGGITELIGPPGAGLTSLALTAAATTSLRGELVAWIDPGFAFDPEGAQREGVPLESFLWLRPADPGQALQAADLLLDGGGFPLVVLDLVLSADAATRLSHTVWPRLARRLRERSAALLLLTRTPLAGALVRATVALQPRAPHALGTSRLTATRSVIAEVLRNRVGPVGTELTLDLQVAPPGLFPGVASTTTDFPPFRDRR